MQYNSVAVKNKEKKDYICHMKVKVKPKYCLIYIESDFYNGGIEIIYYLN